MLKGRKAQRTKQQTPRAAGYFFSAFFLVVIPLLYSRSTIDPVLYPRLTAMAAGLFIAFLLFLFGNPVSWHRTILRNPVFISLLAFVLLTGGSLLRAVNPVEGLTDLFKGILFLFFIWTTVIILNNWPNARIFMFKCLVVTAWVAVTTGIYQFFTLTLPMSDPNVLYEVSGLMAHKNQYSISLFLEMPFLLLAARHLAGHWKTASKIAFVVTLLMILVLQTRAVWAALLIGLLVIVSILLLVEKRTAIIKKELRGFRKPLSLAIVVVLSLVVATFLFRDVFPFNRIVGRLASIFDPAYASNLWRMQMWTATWDLFSDHLLLGVGAGNWKIEIYPYYSEFLPSVFKHWRNPHNDYLLVGSELGLLGLVAYLMVFILLIRVGIRNMLRHQEKGKAIDSAILVFGVIGFVVISFFSFPYERIYPLIYIGVMAAFLLEGEESLQEEREWGRIEKGLLVPMMLLVSLVFLYGVRASINEVNVAKATAAYETGEWRQLNRNAKKIYSDFVPFEPRYSFPVVNYKGMGYFLAEKNMKKALPYFLRAHQEHPTHIRVLNNIGTVYAEMGEYASAARYFSMALDIFPHFEKGLLNLAKAYYKDQEMAKAYQAILACDPRSSNGEITALRVRIESELNGRGSGR